MLKALWAPLVDRYGSPSFGRRRSWIIPMQLLLSASMAAAALASPAEHLGLLLALVFAMNLFAATQDIAVDGLAVDLLGEAELGPGNAAQVVGYKLGMLSAGGLLVAASALIGWSGAFGAMSLLVLAAAVLTLASPEPPSGPRKARVSLREVVGALLAALRLPGARWLLLFVATYKLGESMLDTMFKPFLVDAGFPDWRIGLWLGTFGTAASLAGSVAGGALAVGTAAFRPGKRADALWAAVAITAVLRMLPLVGEWLLAVSGRPSEGAVVAVTLAENFFGGALTTAMFAFMMSRVDRSIGATHFTLLASVEVIGKSPGSWLSGPLAEAYGYAPVFALGVLLSAAFLALLWPVRTAARPA